MVEPNLEDLIANCPSGSQYEIFLKHQDLFDFPLESLEADCDQDVPVMNAAELQHFEPFRTADMRGLSLGNIGIPSPNIGTTLIVPKQEPFHDFVDTSRGNFYYQIDHAASLGGGRNQAQSPDSVFNSNRSSSGEREISRSSNEVIEVVTDMTQSQSSANFSPARRSRRVASREMSRSRDRPPQKKTKLMSQLLDVNEGSERAEREKCSDCGVTQTTQWSDGPNGPNTLCKACGVRYRYGLFLEEHSAATQTSYQDQAFKNEPVSELEHEMSQSSVCFEFHPHADKASPDKRSLNKKMKQPQMRPTTSERHVARKCSHCEVVKTTQWREGPKGPRTLCNACGLRYRTGRLYPEYRPANSPTFVPSIHSSSHREVVEIRRRVTKEASFSEKELTQPLSDAVNEASTELPFASSKANEVATVAGTEPSMFPPLKDIDIEPRTSPCMAREEAPIVEANPSVSAIGREPSISQPKVVQETKTSMLLDLPFKDPKGIIAEPLISLSKAVEEVVMSSIRASMSQFGGSVSDVIEVAYRVERTLEKVKNLKKKLSNLSDQIRSQGSNFAEAEPSMPWDSPSKALKECVIGLLAVNSPPKDTGKTVMADMQAPLSQCGGSAYGFTEGALRSKRVLKMKKKSKKKLPKVSSEGGVKKTLTQVSTVSRTCLHCEVSQTPQWRDGPLGPKTLCNACGLRYKAGGLLPEYRPAASPAFVPTLHSNSQKSVVQMRKKDTHEEAVVGIVTASVHQEAAIAKMEPGTPPPPEFTPLNSYSVNSESGDICCFP